jgi:hypothetical protein
MPTETQNPPTQVLPATDSPVKSQAMIVFTIFRDEGMSVNIHGEGPAREIAEAAYDVLSDALKMSPHFDFSNASKTRGG